MNKTIVIDTTDGVKFAQMCAIKGALGLELKGLKRRGKSAYAIAKEVYKLTGTKQQVFEQLQTKIAEALERKPTGEFTHKGTLQAVDQEFMSDSFASSHMVED